MDTAPPPQPRSYDRVTVKNPTIDQRRGPMLDEPILCPKTDDANPVSNQNPSIREDIHGLLRQEPFGVLCTQGEGQPYGSVVAYAFTQDLSALFFATSTATRKYCLLSACNQVAMVVDNRDRFPNDLMSTSAVTITGRAN